MQSGAPSAGVHLGGASQRRGPKMAAKEDEPAVIHRSSFGEDKEGTLGSFDMSSDIEVYVRAKINQPVGRDQ